MKLSPEAMARMEAIRDRELSSGFVERTRTSPRAAFTANPRFKELMEFYVEKTRRAYKMIINAYLEGYRMDGTLMDREDMMEITQEIKVMVERFHHDITNRMGDPDYSHPVTNEKIPNIDIELKMELNRLVGEAALEVDVARTDLMIEQKKKPTGESAYNLHVYGDLIGGAQVGPNNTQNIQGIHQRNETKQIRWSQLSGGIGTRRVSGVGDIEVTEEDIECVKEVGGNPWVELHDATTFGSPVRKYVLGLFTP